MRLPSLLTVLMLGAGPSQALAQSAGTAASTSSIDAPIARSAHAEAARLSAVHDSAPPPAGRNWARRHPVWTAAMAGGLSGFAIGYLPGDDAVFDDFTAGFNGTVLAGVGAGAGAAVVAIVQAVRRQ